VSGTTQKIGTLNLIKERKSTRMA